MQERYNNLDIENEICHWNYLTLMIPNLLFSYSSLINIPWIYNHMDK